MRAYYSKGGLRQWVADKWVDIGAPKKDGKYQPCGRKKGKAAAKKKFDVYPSAYANIWASKYCKGKVGRTKKAGGGICKVATKGKGNAYGKNS